MNGRGKTSQNKGEDGVKWRDEKGWKGRGCKRGK